MIKPSRVIACNRSPYFLCYGDDQLRENQVLSTKDSITYNETPGLSLSPLAILSSAHFSSRPNVSTCRLIGDGRWCARDKA